MKKNILIFGLISGLIVSIMIVITAILCTQDKDFVGNMWLGYTFMLMALSFVFVGIKNYRDKFNEGLITFGRAFKIGILITLVASTFYVIVWLITYYNFMPDFMDKMAAHTLKSAKANGDSAAEISKQMDQINTYKEMYKNPIFVILLTYMEIVPVGLVITIISSLILKKTQKDDLMVA